MCILNALLMLNKKIKCHAILREALDLPRCEISVTLPVNGGCCLVSFRTDAQSFSVSFEPNKSYNTVLLLVEFNKGRFFT